MNILEAIILGLVQGLTEFIPVSSSGHLVLLHRLLDTHSGLAFDVALHIGTFLALVSIFWRDILSLARSIFIKSPQTRLAWLLALATIPAVISGMLLESRAESSFRSPLLVGVNLILVALLMLAAERYALKRQQSKLERLKPLQAIFIGLAQAVAVIPGISRSGSTITAGIFTGLDRVAATRFSFLLAMPITFGAILKVLSDGDTLNQVGQEASLFAVGIITAFLSGIFAIKFLLKYLSKHSLSVFAYYRIALGIAVIVLLVVF